MSILVIDNEDSFTYNIVDILRKFKTVKHVVVQSKMIEIDFADNFEKIIISPGPGLPNDFPALTEILKRYKARKPILGICLGHQAICSFFGAKLLNLQSVYHGQSRLISVKKRVGLFSDVPDKFNGGLYHSWIVDRNQFPGDLDITAVSEDDFIMAVSHKQYDIHGVQFHPESFVCEYGFEMIRNFIS